MTIELKPEHQQMIDLAIRSGTYKATLVTTGKDFECVGTAVNILGV